LFSHFITYEKNVESVKDKVGSLKWAINELGKQRDELESRLKIARKRDETGALIEEVLAQKDALQKRISALEDGLRVSSELVEIPVTDIEHEVEQVNEKLEIAQERLESLEQEEYLEDLGRKLNRSHSDHNDTSEEMDDYDSDSEESAFASSPDTPPPSISSKKGESLPSHSTSPAATPVLMKSTSNRIQTDESESSETASSRISVVQPEKEISTEETLSSELQGNELSLEETAERLGVEPEFLREKSMQAVLRMIARNQGKLSFPLEVQQID